MAHAPPPNLFLAGRADSEDFARAEHLAEMLMTAVPTFKCRLIPVLPEKWDSYGAKLCGRLGCVLLQPVAWTGAGKVIGDLEDLAAYALRKYKVTLDPDIKDETWERIAKANLATERAKVCAALPDLVPAGSGGERGAAVSEALLLGHERFLKGKSEIPYSASGLAVGVLTMGKLSTPVHKLFDCPDSSAMVVPCGPLGIGAKGARGVLKHPRIGLERSPS